MYFYSPKELASTLNKFIDISNGKVSKLIMHPVSDNDFDAIFEYPYKLKNDKLEIIKIPLEINNDAE